MSDSPAASSLTASSPAVSRSLHLTVADVVKSAPGIHTLDLRDRSGRSLPSFVPGSHVRITCGSALAGGDTDSSSAGSSTVPAGRTRAYSLIGPCLLPSSYRISVLLHPDGTGGSRWLHELKVGDVLEVSTPTSRFAPVLSAHRHLLVAGGIGITPMLSHSREALLWGRDFELHYAYRPGKAAHLAELRSSKLHEYTDRAAAQAGISKALGRQPLGTHLYVCGPIGLMSFVLSEADRLGWPAERIHTERFVGTEFSTGRPVRLRLARSGHDLDVPGDCSLLDALISAGVSVGYQCRQGVCGECRVTVLSGGIDHRDNYLTTAEAEAGTSLMCCVSRGLADELVLEL